MNIYVRPSGRDRTLGSRILRAVEADAAGVFRAMILVNSMLYPTQETKRDAGAFYERNGYVVIARTDDTTVFWKDLAEGGSGLPESIGKEFL